MSEEPAPERCLRYAKERMRSFYNVPTLLPLSRPKPASGHPANAQDGIKFISFCLPICQRPLFFTVEVTPLRFLFYGAKI